MNFIATVELAGGRRVTNVRAVYYSLQDETILWEWKGGTPQILARHDGSPEAYALPGRNTYGWPAGGVSDPGVPSRYFEDGCGCSHPFKHFTPPHPDQVGHAHREHAR